MGADPLKPLREQIDRIDDEMLALLNRRAEVVKQVGKIKQEKQSPFYAPVRERAIVERLSAHNPGPFPTEAIRSVFQEIISACLSLELPLKVAYLGPEATFTHMACKRRFGLSALYVPSATIASVFDEVEKSLADFGVVPIENSTEGVVNHTLDSFIDSPLVIDGEIVLEVSHCLLNRSGDMLLSHELEIPWRETKFEQAANFSGALKGLFLHVELIQPRRASGRGRYNDAQSPDPPFTAAQYDRLALVYVIASVRAQRWLIPAYHAALDADIRNGHDDPLNFDPESFAESIEALVKKLQPPDEVTAANPQ